LAVEVAAARGLGDCGRRDVAAGERGGVAGPDVRGGWTGLSADTTRADLARAALEGVACAVAAALELLGPGAAEPVVLTGGGAREPGVQQLLADALDRPVQHVQVRSASATGAAVLAARGVGEELVPDRSLGPVVTPGGSPALAAARERWVAGG
jgi:xylulokinase